MIVIGLCGGSGSGKGEVSHIFAEFGIPAIDLDAVYHDITSKPSDCLDELTKAFGVEILADNGALDRSRLRHIVFNSENSDQKLKLLNKISHHYVLKKTELIIEDYKNNGASAVIIDAPLLFESGYNQKCNIIIGVIANKDIRIERIIRRDGIDRESAELRISKQLSDEYISANSDFIIVNNHSIESLRKEVYKIIKNTLHL